MAVLRDLPKTITRTFSRSAPPARPTTPDGRFILDHAWGVVQPDVPVAVDDVSVWRAESFPPSGPVPWLDAPDADVEVRRRREAGDLTAFEAELCRKWIRDGYVIVKDLLDPFEVDWAWDAYLAAIEDGRVETPDEPQFAGDTVPGRVLDPHFEVPELAAIQRHESIVRVVELLLGARVIPFQTITSHKASQQPMHSDSIHMSTYPTQYLCANWIAFGDIEPDCGPLEFYPGSHRLPVLTATECGISLDAWQTSRAREFDEKYTPELLARRDRWVAAGHEARYFTAKKGDILFWHANLIHGGSTRRNFERDRLSLVCHYFGEGCVCYHDWTNGLSRVHFDDDYAQAVHAAEAEVNRVRRAAGLGRWGR